MRIDRRRFLQVSSGIAVAVVAGKSAYAAAGDDPYLAAIPKIDTHQHLWDLTKFQPPWLADASAVLNRSYVTSDFLTATQDLNIVKTVYMEVDAAEQDQIREARHAIALCRSDQHPTVGAVISGRPGSDKFAGYIAQFKNTSEVKGLRQVLHGNDTPQGFCLQPQFVKSVQLLGEMSKTFDICIRPAELRDAIQLAKQCPATRLILDHCGNGDPHAFLSESQQTEKPWHTAKQWKDDISRLAETKNVTCKISGIVARAPKDWRPEHLAPLINHCLDAFGPDRVVYGGDWPVCLLGGKYREWMAALCQVISNRSTTDQQKMFHDNAVKVYGLS